MPFWEAAGQSAGSTKITCAEGPGLRQAGGHLTAVRVPPHLARPHCYRPAKIRLIDRYEKNP